MLSIVPAMLCKTDVGKSSKFLFLANAPGYLYCDAGDSCLACSEEPVNRPTSNQVSVAVWKLTGSAIQTACRVQNALEITNKTTAWRFDARLARV